MVRKAPRWLAPAVIWLVSVLVLSHTGHLWMLILLPEPSVTRDAQYGLFLFMTMGYGWVLGVLPAGYAWRLLDRGTVLWRSLALSAMAYWAVLFLVITLTEVIRLGSPMTLWRLPSLIVAFPASLTATSMVFRSPSMLALSALGLLPMMGLLWWFGASGRRDRSCGKLISHRQRS